MTKPTITYGHQFLHDCDSTTGWTEDGAPTLTDTTLACEHGDILKLGGTAAAAGKSTYWEYNCTNFSSSDWPYFLIRWKTSIAAVGLGAKVELATTGDPVVIMGSDAPKFNTTWKTTSGTIPSGKTITEVRFYAESDVACSGEFVYYDFILIHKAIFTLPFFDKVRLELPRKDVEIDIPGRDGGIIQKLGLKSPIIVLSGDMMFVDDDDVAVAGTTWGTIYYKYGEYLLKIIRDSDPWQWLTSDIIKCKATPANDPFFLEQTNTSEGAQRVFGLRFKQYSLSSLGETTWDDRQWYGY